MKKAIIYVRVSSKEQLEGSSLEVQERICTEFSLRNDYEIVKVFREMGESAKTTDRTELKLLLEYIAKNFKNLDALIVAKIDRLARNSIDHALLKVGFSKYNLRLVSATENLEDTPVGRLMETQLAGFAQFDNEIRTERSTGGMEAAVKNGRWVWGASRGYLNSGGRGTSNLILDEPEVVELVRHIWVLLDTGCTPEEARKEITKKGLTSKKGKAISKSQFHRMIRNPIYMGVIKQFGLTIVGNFKPIVEPELFLRVLGKLDKNAKKMPIYRKDNEEFPIRGLVICDACKKGLTASWSRGNGGKYAFYRCTHCPKKNYRRDDRDGHDGLETKFIKFLNGYHYKQELKEALIKAIEANFEIRNEANKKRLSELNSQITQLKAKEKQIAEKNFKNVISDRVAKEMLEENEERISNLVLQLNEHIDVKDEVMKVARHSIGVLEDISGVWMRVDLDIKKRFQKFLFPDGLLYDGEKFGTTRLAYCIEPKYTSSLQKFRNVSPEGLEPSTNSLKGSCSTIEL